MMVVVQLVVVVALVTLVKMGTRRLFRGRARDQHQLDNEAKPEAEPSVEAAPRDKPKPTSRTNGPRRH